MSVALNRTRPCRQNSHSWLRRLATTRTSLRSCDGIDFDVSQDLVGLAVRRGIDLLDELDPHFAVAAGFHRNRTSTEFDAVTSVASADLERPVGAALEHRAPPVRRHPPERRAAARATRRGEDVVMRPKHGSGRKVARRGALDERSGTKGRAACRDGRDWNGADEGLAERRGARRLRRFSLTTNFFVAMLPAS